MKLLLRFLPEPWRTRYRDEITDALSASETKWRDRSDVAVWGVKLRIERHPYRFGALLALATAFVLLYGALALGVVGEEGDPFDRYYAIVLGVGLIGSLIARFRPRGMAHALFATAFAQACVTVAALIVGKHNSPVSSVPEIVILNGCFIALFVGSALLFRYAGQERCPDGIGRNHT